MSWEDQVVSLLTPQRALALAAGKMADAKENIALS